MLRCNRGRAQSNACAVSRRPAREERRWTALWFWSASNRTTYTECHVEPMPIILRLVEAVKLLHSIKCPAFSFIRPALSAAFHQ